MPDIISTILGRSGILHEGECLRCEVCCRFPDAGTPLAPWFAHAEMEAALAHGMPADAFPPGRYGPGASVQPVPEGNAFRCPAFRLASNDCGIYAERPLDCRLYPFMLSYDPSGTRVELGLDTYCPAALRAREAQLTAAATELGDALEKGLRSAILARPGVVGPWKDHVRPLRDLPALSRDLCRTDLGLARLTPTVYDQLAHYFAAHGGHLSGQALPTIHAWSDVYALRWKTVGDRLLIFAVGEGDCYLVCPPLGRGDMAPAADEALRILRELDPHCPTFRIQDVDDASADALLRLDWRTRETRIEYAYRRDDLADLRGNRFEKKRQLCNRFERDRARSASPAAEAVQWRAFESADLPQAAALYRRWLAARTERHSDLLYAAQAEASFRSFCRTLRDGELLGLPARVLLVNGRLTGVTVGCPLHDGKSFHVMFEVADLSTRGAAQYMFRAFCRELTGWELINAGGASELGNLAAVKESYRPALRPTCRVMTHA